MDDSTTKKRPPARAGTPVSQRIRERLVASRERFHANDNISRYIEAGELARAV